MILTKQQKEILKKQLAEKQVQLKLFGILTIALVFSGVFIMLFFDFLIGILLFLLGIIGAVGAQRTKDFIDKIRFQLAGK